MRRSFSIAIAVAALIASMPLLGGCADERVQPVALLQLSAPPVVAQPGGQRADLHVRASLGPPAGESGAPPVYVPDVGSLATGTPHAGRLVNGLQLPAVGPDWVALSPPDHRWTTDRMLAFLLAVMRDYRLANPGAPVVAVGDLSLPSGGPFAGHVSHQNGLDADVYYPRLDRTAQAPRGAQDVDRRLAQDLVDRFVAYGAQFAFVGPHVGLTGPPPIVQILRNHDDHVHVRIADSRQ